MRKLTSVLIVASFMLALLPIAASAHTEGAPFVTDLMAGRQHIDVGDVSVWNDGDDLYVKYETTGGWELVETHLHVAISMEDIPQKNGNPIPGHFDHDPGIAGLPYPIPLEWLVGTELYIAAHAEVQQVLALAPYYACLVVESNQGLRKDSSLVVPARSVPEQGLEFEIGRNESNFFSLGFGGWIIVEFCCPIRNGEGNDVKVIEDTWGSYPLEKAKVYASQDSISWAYLGEADNTNPVGIHTISEFDLGALAWAKYIKIEDTTDPAVHASNADGFDLNAVEVLQDCIQEETAWGEGPGFPGKNWAMYFTYTVQGG